MPKIVNIIFFKLLNSSNGINFQFPIIHRRRCLRECEFLPPIATFIEKAMQGRKIALLKESGEQPQIEHTSEAVPMPDEFKKLYKKFIDSKTLN